MALEWECLWKSKHIPITVPFISDPWKHLVSKGLWAGITFNNIQYFDP